MEQLFNGFTLEIPSGQFPLSTDSVLLSHFVKLNKRARVLDLGSGCGTLGLLMCAKDPSCTVTGIELSADAHNAAVQNILDNGLQERLFSICGDLRTIAQEMQPGSFDICLSNPPYFTGGPASLSNPNARRADCCSTKELFCSAAYALKWGGDFYLVHKPEALGNICGWAVKSGLEPKVLLLVRHDSTKPVSLILLKCRKGGKPGLIWEELCLFTPDNQPTDEYRKIYHL